MLSFALWTLWLLLGVLLALQLYLLTARQLAVPAFILRALESRLAASHLAVRFGHATFDPSGRIVAEDIRLESSDFAEPLFTARGLYVRLDPWALLAGHFDPREVRVADAGFFVPAILSPSGQTEALVSGCTLDLLPHHQTIELAQFTCRANNLVITAHGALRLPASANTATTGVLPLVDFFAQNYPRLSRQLAGLTEELAAFDEPLLHLELTPSDTRGALVTATLGARAFHRETPWSLRATNLRVTARAPLLGVAAAPATLDVSADELSLPGGASAQVARLHVRGVAWPGLPRFLPRNIDFSAATLDGFSLHAADLLARITPGAPDPLSDARIEAAMRLAGEPVSLHAETDLKKQSALVGFDAAIAPALLTPISAWLHSDLPKLLVFTSPLALRGSARISAGWRFASLSTWLEAGPLEVQGVPLDAVRGQVKLSGHELSATDVVLHQHDNLVSGSYTMDTSTNDYRFLVQGKLRPLDINGWFTSWWPTFWKNFAFSQAPPAADLDLHGRWGDARRTDVFVFADGASPAVRGVPFDRVRVILHIADNFYDGREVFLARGARTARGHFTRLIDVVQDTWQHMEFDVTSNLDLAECARLFDDGEDFIAPFKFAQPPTLHATGVLDSPSSPGGAHQRVQFVVASAGAFSLFDFPFSDASFDASLRDNDIDLPRINATFAGGALNGRARLTGADSVRRLRFDLHLSGASLGRAITTVDDFIAKQKNQPSDPPTQFIQRATDVRLDLAAAAEGRYHDPLSFTGNGSVEIAGAELTQIHLFGALSQLLSFTSLRFTKARGNFNIEQAKLGFTEVKATGANSAIDAKGDYFLDKKTLDFNAKVYPFQESKFPLTNIVGLVLTPVSAALEVKLTGTLDKPAWAFVFGPTNFIRKLTQPKSNAPTEKPSPTSNEGENISPYLIR
ncbi:MAG TPA: AsmA-like C-terminal region-containing protein [Opitutaceae bacterium]|jgi:hypothetical protein|nr:AsmA-like C-terminal region-containing protein [Opitutaceae bacterium]